MRKTILFLLFLCAHWVAQGQMPYEYRYWFDGDESGQRTGTSATPQWSMALDLDGLSQSFHSLHFQVKDTVWSSPVTRYFLKVPEEGPKTFTYWFDNGYREAVTATVTDGTAVLDVSQLTDGMHFMHIAYDMDGQNSLPKTAVFWKQPLEGQLRYRLWMDNDPGTQQSGDYNGQPIELDVSAMDDGFHILHAQIEGRGTASIPYTQMFIKVPQTVGVDYLTCLFMVDSEVYKQERVPAEGGAVHWEFDATSIPQGLHKAQGLIVTPSGVASNVQEAFFYRTMTTAEKAAMQCYYSIDGDTHRHQAGKLTGDLFHFDLDVSELSDGFHRLSYMLMDPNGASSKVMSAFFIKTPLGGNGITQYTYWLNDNEENMHSVQLEERTNPFKLITLLPVEACPIRSSCFCFEVEDGQPMVYARNDLHVRFYDVAGRITEASERYVDYNVGEEVTDVVALADSEGKVSEDRPEENGILWYSMDAVIGDSLSVKSNRACTLQIFAPDGEEVYAASGAESVAFGGCHAYKDGTYYIALHDVTATGGTDVELSYQHIDKYAVLEYSPASFGTPSSVNVDLLGNGFSDTTRVALYDGSGMEYWAQAVSANSLSELTARFEIADSLDGAYSLKVLYTDKDSVCVVDAIRIAPRDSVPEVSIALEGNAYYLAGTSATYQVKFTNHSNIPVYNLPFTISIYCQDGENTVSGLKLGDGVGKESKEAFREWLRGYLDEAQTEQLLQSLYGEDDLKAFFQWTDSVDGKIYLIGHFALPYLNANSTLSIPLTITKAEHNFTLYASTKKNWDVAYRVVGDGNHGSESRPGDDGGDDGDAGTGGSGSTGAGSTGGSGSTGSSGSGSVGSGGTGASGGGDDTGEGEEDCCVMAAATCMTTLVTSAIPMNEWVGEWTETCVNGHLENFFGGVFSDIFCEGNATDFNKRPQSPQSAWRDVTQSVIQCTIENAVAISGDAALSALLDKLTRGLLGKVLTIRDIVGDCVVSPMKTWVEGCGDDGGDDAEADPINSYDPNDIYGYQAPSGSKAIKKDLEEVDYTIEFENDPEFATTAAHEVIVTDTLDRARFDLDSFRPTSLKIGDRYVELDGEPSTISTVDMRPEVNAIAQMELDYDASKGIAKWKFTSLDPMTMERTDNPMSGFLPVNSDGNGIGEVSFRIGLLPTLDDGELVENRASIVFDQNDAIITPTWVNVVDTIAPVSTIAACEARNDSTVVLRFEATDNRSGVWRYDLYVQESTDAPWTKVAEGVEDDEYEFKGFSGFDYGFCVMATDSAGNMEAKALQREAAKPTYTAGDANGDGVVDVLDASLATDKFLGKTVYLNFEATDVNNDELIDAMDVSLIRQIFLSTVTRRSMMVRMRITTTR